MKRHMRRNRAWKKLHPEKKPRSLARRERKVSKPKATMSIIPEIDLGLNPKDLVRHRIYGVGEVVSGWGSFAACPDCTKLVGERSGDTYLKWGTRLDKKKGEIVPVQRTACCNRMVNNISGEGIFDIKFGDGKTRSINQTWLKRVSVALAMILSTLTLVGCASTAWRDLGDGAGMRGWAGVPLKYTAPLAPLAALRAPERSNLWPRSAFTTHTGNTSYTTYSGF